MTKFHYFILALLLNPDLLLGQYETDDYLILSFDNVIEMAIQQSPASVLKKTEKENSYWSYRSFLATFKPQVLLDANIPGFTKSYQLVTQPDGSKKGSSVFQSNSSAGISASQLFGKTGGSLYINSDLYTSYNFLDSSSQFTSTPLEIAYIQPIFQFNNYKWDQKIEKLRYEESIRSYYYEMEQVSKNATDIFFNLMIAQIQKDISSLNLQNNDTIYKIARGRYDLGRIAENEFLQIELQFLRSKQELEQAELEIKNSSLRLKNYLGIKDDRDIILLLPDVIPTFDVDPQLALEKAKIHRPEMINYERQLLEAEANSKEAHANAGLNADLALGFGLSSSSNEIHNIYSDFGDKQTLNVRLSVPIVDWGRSKANINMAEANQDLVEYNIEQQMVDFDQEITTHVNYFLQTRNQIQLSKKSDEIAEKRYEVAKQRYMIGHISITDINIATKEKDEAKKAYISTLKNFWSAYYQLRKITMYDFMFNKNIIPSDE